MIGDCATCGLGVKARAAGLCSRPQCVYSEWKRQRGLVEGETTPPRVTRHWEWEWCAEHAEQYGVAGRWQRQRFEGVRPQSETDAHKRLATMGVRSTPSHPVRIVEVITAELYHAPEPDR